MHEWVHKDKILNVVSSWKKELFRHNYFWFKIGIFFLQMIKLYKGNDAHKDFSYCEVEN